MSRESVVLKKAMLVWAIGLALWLPACAVQPAATSKPAKTTLTILAAASLTESFSELALRFESAHPGVEVQLNFAGSQQLVLQLSQAAPGDVFASANQKQMDAAVQTRRIDAASSRIFAKNRLVVVYPLVNPANVSALSDLTRPGLKLILANREVPVGQYTIDFLSKADKDAQFGPTYQTDVLRNVASYENTVKGVLNKVILGEADAGVVYSTDISTDAAGKVGRIEIPDALNVIAVYPIAALNDSPNPDLANAFVALVLSPQGQEVLAKYGFLKPDGQ